MDKKFFTKKLPDYRTFIQTKPDAMKMRCLKNALFIITKHLLIIFNIFGQTVDGFPVIINFTGHIYIMEKFKTKILVKNGILNPEIMVPNIGKNVLTIGNCKNMSVKFNINNIGPPVKLLRPQSKQKRFAAKRLPKFELGNLGKRSGTFLKFHLIYIYRYFANKKLFFLTVNTFIH